MKKRNSKHFKPVWWLKNRHFQSCFSTFFPLRAKAVLTWEQLELPDGDFIDLCWAGPEQARILVLLHGLEGSVKSHYVQLMLDTLVENQWRVVVMHFRSCSGRLNRLSRSYHAGEVGDLDYLIRALKIRYPDRSISSLGFSLGGNVLLHYLAQFPQSTLQSAVAVSVPFELSQCVDYLPRFYQWSFLRTMKQKAFEKIKLGYDMPINLKELKTLFDFRSFDDALTGPLHGFCGARDYYEKMTIRHSLSMIQHPTLIIHALDDPLVPAECIPKSTELSPSIHLELFQVGGHVGFIEGVFPWKLNYWLKGRILSFLSDPIS